MKKADRKALGLEGPLLMHLLDFSGHTDFACSVYFRLNRLLPRLQSLMGGVTLSSSAAMAASGPKCELLACVAQHQEPTSLDEEKQYLRGISPA